MTTSIVTRFPALVPTSIAILFLLGALSGKWPYGYYTLLQIIVCGAAIYIGIIAHDDEKLWLMWVMVGVVVLFNPLIPIHMERDTWLVFDAGAGVVFAIAAVVLRPANKPNRKGQSL